MKKEVRFAVRMYWSGSDETVTKDIRLILCRSYNFSNNFISFTLIHTGMSLCKDFVMISFRHGANTKKISPLLRSTYKIGIRRNAPRCEGVPSSERRRALCGDSSFLFGDKGASARVKNLQTSHGSGTTKTNCLRFQGIFFRHTGRS